MKGQLHISQGRPAKDRPCVEFKLPDIACRFQSLSPLESFAPQHPAVVATAVARGGHLESVSVLGERKVAIGGVRLSSAPRLQRPTALVVNRARNQQRASVAQ
jgi:hypothetical protein